MPVSLQGRGFPGLLFNVYVNPWDSLWSRDWGHLRLPSGRVKFAKLSQKPLTRTNSPLFWRIWAYFAQFLRNELERYLMEVSENVNPDKLTIVNTLLI